MTKSVATLSSNDPRVISFFNKYHESILTNPKLYQSKGNVVAIALPSNLIEYANAASGHTGYGSGARSYGIFKPSSNVASDIANIFHSVESLTNFINSSECDAHDYIIAVRNRPVKSSNILKGIQSVYFNTKERKDVMIKLFNETPIGEIELTYGNRNNNYDLSVYAE